MQTFLPHGSDFAATAKILDNRRLGKQRVEVLQILRAINGESRGWVNHPATLMWRDHSRALVQYGLAICEEWVRRGCLDTCSEKIRKFDIAHGVDVKMPKWLDHDAITITHRGSLYLKDPLHYAEFEYESYDMGLFVCCATCTYWWPSHAQSA